MRAAESAHRAPAEPQAPLRRSEISLQGRALRAPGLRVKLVAYDLTEEVEIRPSATNHHVANVLSGSGQRIVGYAASQAFAPRPANWGALSFVPARMPAWLRAGAGRVRVCQLRFAPEKAEALFERRLNWRFDSLAAYAGLRSRSILSGMQQLEQECLEPGDAHATLVDAVGSAIIIELCRQFASEHGPGTVSKLAPWQLRRVEEYARAAACTQPANVAVFAELCGVSASHLARCFKQTTGLTVHAYVQSIRIERARTLLAESGLPLKEIAAACGFATPRYFSTAFRRAAGESPRNYRARTQAKVYRLSTWARAG
jgi:AraC family transcriptional regulator